MNDTNARNRIREALQIRNMKQVELAEKTGIAKGTINNWLNNRYQPKQKALMKMAKVLEVSELWLAGYNVPMERPTEQKKSDELAQLIHSIRKDEELKDLVVSICTLNDEQRKTIKSIVTELSKINSLH
jgi:transcriptional regulator with XRE-family HTH domain